MIKPLAKTLFLILYLPLISHGNEFSKIITPFMEKYCVDCHDADMQEGDIALHNLKSFTAENVTLWKQIWEQVSLKEMPPRKKKKQPDLLKRLEISNFITSELSKVMEDKGGFTEHMHPIKGNHLDHDLLFKYKHQSLEPASSPARLWRIHPQEHLVRLNDLIQREQAFDPKKPGMNARGDHIVADSRGNVKVYFGLQNMRMKLKGGQARDLARKGFPAPLSAVKDHGLKNYPYMYSVNSSETSQILQLGEKIVKYVAYGPDAKPEQFIDPGKKSSKKKGGKYPIMYVRDKYRESTPLAKFATSQGVDEQLLEKAISFLFESITCRPPTAAEVAKYKSMALKSIKSIGKKDGLSVGLAPIFLATDALFKSELASYGEADKYGRVMLQGHELELAVNSAFSYLPPDEKLR